MRSKEFIGERRNNRGQNLKKGKMPHTHAEATPGAIRNRGYYDLYRASMAIAGMDKDGNIENDVDPASWIGGDGYVGTYTPEEEAMARKAFKHLGMPVSQHMPGPSMEPDAVNTQSPMQGFKGYPR